MIKTFKLLLPALMPSWNFFDTIGPSPRIEFTLLSSCHGTPTLWHPYRPRPQHLPLKTMLMRLFWNPWWNESLFLTSCAERLDTKPTDHSFQEIARRLQKDLQQSSFDLTQKSHCQFRLVFIKRSGTTLATEITYTSPVFCASKEIAS